MKTQYILIILIIGLVLIGGCVTTNDRDSGDQNNEDYGYDSSEDSETSGSGDIPSPPALPLS